MFLRVLLLSLLLPLQQGSTLRWAPKEGDKIKYRTVGALSAAGTEVTITQETAQEVIRVDPDGSFIVQATPSQGKVSYAGQELDSKGVTTLTTYGPDGEIKDIQGDTADATAYRMANLTEFHAPNKPVTTGDAWTRVGKADLRTGAVPWKVDYKVTGEEQIGPYPAIKLDVNARETEGSEAGKATGAIWVGKDGVLVRTDLTWTNIKVPGAPGAVSGKIQRTRIG